MFSSYHGGPPPTEQGRRWPLFHAVVCSIREQLREWPGAWWAELIPVDVREVASQHEGKVESEGKHERDDASSALATGLDMPEWAFVHYHRYVDMCRPGTSVNLRCVFGSRPTH